MHLSTPVIVAVFALLLAAFVAAMHRLRTGARAQTDPQRAFTPAQRAAGFARAGNRCEHKPWLGPRCTAAPTHGDHVYPHSRGGATTLANFQALCARHNLRKSDRVPSMWAIRRLERRRARYFPDPAQARVEHRIGVSPPRW